MRTQFPNSFVFYVFVQVLAIATVWVADPTVTGLTTQAVRFEFPPTFLFMLGLASATLLLYIPFVLLSYVKRVHARPTVIRDVYMIILGVSGYTVSEFVVEVILPFYAIDVRALGFIVEMALVGLVAYAVRERGFLEDLLVPQAEPVLLPVGGHAVAAGQDQAGRLAPRRGRQPRPGHVEVLLLESPLHHRLVDLVLELVALGEELFPLGLPGLGVELLEPGGLRLVARCDLEHEGLSVGSRHELGGTVDALDEVGTDRHRPGGLLQGHGADFPKLPPHRDAVSRRFCGKTVGDQ